MDGKRRWLVVAVLAVAALLAGIWLLPRRGGPTGTTGADPPHFGARAVPIDQVVYNTGEDHLRLLRNDNQLPEGCRDHLYSFVNNSAATGVDLAANAYGFADRYDTTLVDVWECRTANHATDHLLQKYAAAASPQRLDYFNPQPSGACSGRSLTFSFTTAQGASATGNITLQTTGDCVALHDDMAASSTAPRDSQRAHLIHETSGPKPVEYRYQLRP